jgi:hypothetical protein
MPKCLSSPLYTWNSYVVFRILLRLFKEHSSFSNFMFHFLPFIILPVICFSMAAFSLYHTFFFFCKMCEIEISSFFGLLIYVVRSASVYIFILSFLSWPCIINHASSHHNFFVAPIFTPLPTLSTLFTTNMQDLTLTNTCSVLIIFHSSASGTLITRLNIPHSLASRVHFWNPSFFVAPRYYRKTRMILTSWYKSREGEEKRKL